MLFIVIQFITDPDFADGCGDESRQLLTAPSSRISIFLQLLYDRVHLPQLRVQRLHLHNASIPTDTHLNVYIYTNLRTVYTVSYTILTAQQAHNHILCTCMVDRTHA